MTNSAVVSRTSRAHRARRNATAERDPKAALFFCHVQLGRSVSLGKAARQPEIRARPAAPDREADGRCRRNRQLLLPFFSVTKHKTNAVCSAQNRVCVRAPRLLLVRAPRAAPSRALSAPGAGLTQRISPLIATLSGSHRCAPPLLSGASAGGGVFPSVAPRPTGCRFRSPPQAPPDAAHLCPDRNSGLPHVQIVR